MSVISYPKEHCSYIRSGSTEKYNHKHIRHLVLCALFVVTVNAKNNTEEFDYNIMYKEGILNESHWKLGNVPDIGLSEDNREALCQMLNTILADEYILYTKARNYHWNVLGIHFNDLHSFFQKIYEQLTMFVDTVAERVRALGGRSYGTLEEFINTTRLTESPGEVSSPGMMVENLLSDFETLIRAMRPDVDTAYDTYGDAVTNNMLIEILTAHEKTAWMLRALADEVYGSECLRNQQR